MEENQTGNNQEIQKPVDVDTPGADSVTQDINRFKVYFRKLTGGFQQKAKPVKEKVQQKIIEKTPDAVIQKIPKKAGFGWVKFMFIPVFILFVALIMFSLVKNVSENGEEEGSPKPTGVQKPTPTLEPFQPVQQSIYADDEEIKDLQEELNVVNNEMFSVPLRDSTLNLPILDFNINFGDKR